MQTCGTILGVDVEDGALIECEKSWPCDVHGDGDAEDPDQTAEIDQQLSGRWEK